ncbi:MAG TPA: dihydrodipicolinate synthase family protein [Acidimicrobiales bacterium]
MTELTFQGVGVALITIFDEYLALDAKRTADLAAELVACGVTGVIVAGTTGEAAALNGQERAALVAATRAALPSDVPVLAGIGAPSTFQALDYLEQVVDAGADAVLALSLPGGADQSAYYEALAKQAGGLPLLAYNYPGASAPGIPVEVLVKLPVQGVKDSSGDPDRLIESKALFDEPIYTGAASLLTLAGGIGCAGAILALANAIPEVCVAALGGDGTAQASISESNRRAKSSFPSGIKELTAERFHTPIYKRMG